MTVLVFANGDFEAGPWVEPYLSSATAVIAADGGLRHARALGLRPDVVIGDMDSLPPHSETELAAAGRVVRFPREKDETDLELALAYAAEHNNEPIRILGATGGRFDHMLANILLLASPALAGRDVRAVGPHETIWLVTAWTEVVGQVGDIVSLIPVGGDAVVAATTGLLWALHNETLRFGQARGVSNELIAPRATVEVADGQLICVHGT